MGQTANPPGWVKDRPVESPGRSTFASVSTILLILSTLPWPISMLQASVSNSRRGWVTPWAGYQLWPGMDSLRQKHQLLSEYSHPWNLKSASEIFPSKPKYPVSIHSMPTLTWAARPTWTSTHNQHLQIVFDPCLNVPNRNKKTVWRGLRGR